MRTSRPEASWKLEASQQTLITQGLIISVFFTKQVFINSKVDVQAFQHYSVMIRSCGNSAPCVAGREGKVWSKYPSRGNGKCCHFPVLGEPSNNFFLYIMESIAEFNMRIW